jgi:long-subunit acyl-CoA synthetase (AMP-forming)
MGLRDVQQDNVWIPGGFFSEIYEICTERQGELVIRGPQVMKGYWHRPEETAVAMAGG